MTVTSVNPARPAEVVGTVPRRDRGRRRPRPSRRPPPRSGPGPGCPSRPGPRSSPRPARCSPRARPSCPTLVAREAGKILVEAGGDVQEAIDMADFVAGQGRAAWGETVPSELRQQAVLDDPPAGRRRRDDHAVELPGRHPVVEVLPGAARRQRHRAQAVRARARVLPRRSSPPASRPACPTASSRSCTATPSRPPRSPSTPASARSASPARCRPAARSRRRPWRPGPGSCRSSSAARTRWSCRPDADLDLAVDGALFGAFGTAGQRCTSTSRLDRPPRRRRASSSSASRSGPASSCSATRPTPATDVGPVIDRAAGRRASPAMVDAARRRGRRRSPAAARSSTSTAATAARSSPRPCSPACEPEHRIAREEVFGPVLAVIEVGRPRRGHRRRERASSTGCRPRSTRATSTPRCTPSTASTPASST